MGQRFDPPRDVVDGGAISRRPVEICIENLSKAYGDNHVLRGVNLAIHRGEIVAVVGGSGSGKTVLLEHVIGLRQPDQGHVFIADHESPGDSLVDLTTLDDDGLDRIRRHWAVVFQRGALLSGTVYENIALWLREVKGLGEDEIRRRVRRAIEAVGLNPDIVLEQDRDMLSGGMVVRVAIARALSKDPILVFYDEPTTGLDPAHARQIQDLIATMHRRPAEDGSERTTVIITHDKDLLRRLQPRIIMLHEGRVFFDGPYQMFAQSDSPVVRPYFDLMPGLHQRERPA